MGAHIRPREHTQILNSITDLPSSAHCCRPGQGPVPGRSYTLPILTPGIKKEAPPGAEPQPTEKIFPERRAQAAKARL